MSKLLAQYRKCEKCNMLIKGPCPSDEFCVPNTKIFVIKRAKISKSNMLAATKQGAIAMALATLAPNEILLSVKEKT